MSKMSLIDDFHITNDDISWVCDLLQLPEDAFHGTDGNDPRAEILKSIETLDVEACPGSGKTTLLVAKLAILARKWRNPRQGICVLSHTNVARREIEHRLGNTVEGKRLLSYPHFIGTIHGFVNEFLAIPWLRSKSLPIRMIDNKISRTRRWKKLPQWAKKTLERSKYTSEIMTVKETDFSIGDLRWGKGKLGRDTSLYKSIQNACKTTIKEGFFCHDEMFLWGNEYLDQIWDICQVIRERFPLLFIDEVQDNSELQSELLFRLFMEGENPVIRQRFGDSNQAIYQHQREHAAKTDFFPDPSVRRDIPNSYRFGQNIADFADPLALNPQGLVGCGPSRKIVKSDTENNHTIFLFDYKNMVNVIPTYAEYLMDLFSDEELQKGTFTAIGAVHRPIKDDHHPRFVGHYWADYDHEISQVDPTPNTFLQYVMIGRKWSDSSGESHYIVEKVAEGILRLVRHIDPSVELPHRGRKHRRMINLLSESPKTLNNYLDLVTFFASERRIPTVEEWNVKWVKVIRQVVSTLVGQEVNDQVVKEFLEWRVVKDYSEQSVIPPIRDNLFRYPSDDPKVKIRMGSIHSVKGETHTATLVLDTYFKGHHLKILKPWLLGLKAGRGKEGNQIIYRLKQHYVAMTRPSHLLCLALQKDAISATEVDELKKAKWRVASVTDSAPIWM